MSKSTERFKFALNILLILAPVLEQIFAMIDAYKENKEPSK